MFGIKSALIITIVICYIHSVDCLLPPPFKSDGNNVDKGFNILEKASKVIPQGSVVKTAKESWKFIWTRMMTELAPQDKTGSYTRPSYSFTGKLGSSEFPYEAGRYAVYVGNPCPWCHRVKLAVVLRKLMSEVKVISLVDDPIKASRGGWIFDPKRGDRDPLGCEDLRELYEKLSPNYSGRCTAPILIDLKAQKIVSNESSDIVRMINNAKFGAKDSDAIDLYPTELADIIDESNEWIYRLLNNGVYRCGFSTQQSAYNSASNDVREGLGRVESILQGQPFICGNEFTESDLRLLPTILRFDGAYSLLFRAGGGHLRIKDYPNLLAWLQRCWDMDGISSTIDIDDAVSSYYRQLFPLNPGGLIPSTPTLEEIGLKV